VPSLVELALRAHARCMNSRGLLTERHAIRDIPAIWAFANGHLISTLEMGEGEIRTAIFVSAYKLAINIIIILWCPLLAR